MDCGPDYCIGNIQVGLLEFATFKTVFVVQHGNHQMTMFAKAQHWMNISSFSNCRNVNKIFVVTDHLIQKK
jgi:hypothetical protein